MEKGYCSNEGTLSRSIVTESIKGLGSAISLLCDELRLILMLHFATSKAQPLAVQRLCHSNMHDVFARGVQDSGAAPKRPLFVDLRHGPPKRSMQRLNPKLRFSISTTNRPIRQFHRHPS